MSIDYQHSESSNQPTKRGKRCAVSDQDIEASLDYLAHLIDRYGDQFWPIFDRLDRELEARRMRTARIQARLNRHKKPVRITEK